MTTDELRAEGGHLHLTLSFLISAEAMRSLLSNGDGDHWNDDLLARLHREPATGGRPGGDGLDYHDSRRLGRAIEPLFNDIADRGRGLFTEDFLLDTPNGAAGDGEVNVCDEVELHFPAVVRWETEGRSFLLALERPARLRATCRAFWVVHSNASLTYHLSFEVAYRHRTADYYALALLQKAVFPTEGTRGLGPGVRVRSLAGSPETTTSLYDHVAGLFELHAQDLVGRVRRDLASTRGVVVDARPRAGTLWDHLIGEPTPGPPETEPALGDLRCRSVHLLQDPYFFALLHPDVRRQIPELVEIRPTSDRAARTSVYDEADLAPASCPPDQLGYYFLSGYLQNIVDFLRQDASEVRDGTDPLYPPAGVDDESHFLVFGSQTSTYEIVARSRSLEVGNEWIGTCPYLFLVHLMTMHNESLVRDYEAMVRTLISDLEGNGLLDPTSVGTARPRVADEAFRKFRAFRLETFNRIAKHRYFNVLRYDTERAFYSSIEAVRGIRQREEYWATVVADLEGTLDDLRTDAAQSGERVVQRVLFYVAFVGVLQLVVQMIDYGYDGSWGRLRSSLLAGGIVVVAMLVIFEARGLLGRQRGWSPRRRS